MRYHDDVFTLLGQRRNDRLDVAGVVGHGCGREGITAANGGDGDCEGWVSVFSELGYDVGIEWHWGEGARDYDDGGFGTEGTHFGFVCGGFGRRAVMERMDLASTQWRKGEF